jgi:hypothetical protein
LRAPNYRRSRLLGKHRSSDWCTVHERGNRNGSRCEWESKCGLVVDQRTKQINAKRAKSPKTRSTEQPPPWSLVLFAAQPQPPTFSQKDPLPHDSIFRTPKPASPNPSSTRCIGAPLLRIVDSSKGDHCCQPVFIH